MPASKKTTKTTKTAHVLNVLTGGQEPSEPVSEDTAATPPRHTAPPQPPAAPVVEVASPDDDLSGQIMDALAEELGDNPPQPAAPVQPAPQPPTPAPAPTPAAVQPAVKPDFSAQPAPQPISAPVQPAPELARTAAQAVESTPSEYINIVQALVEEKAPKYIEMLGVCKCSRCVADVKALTLSNLPPKYIVVPKSQRVPMLTVYEGKYNAAITAQLITACRAIMDSPRHSF